MIGIDSALLDLTEWLCRKFQLLTGRTNVWLAIQFTNLSIIMYFVWAAVYFQGVTMAARIAVALFCSGVLYVLSQTVFKVSIEGSEDNAYRRVAKGLRNPRRIRDAPLRISFLTLSVLYPLLFIYINLRIPVALLSYPLVVLTTGVLYLLACDPLPPCAGRLRERLRGSAPSRVVEVSPDPLRLGNPLLAAQFGVCVADVGFRKKFEEFPLTVFSSQRGHDGFDNRVA
jgi:hypothetical protein